MSLIDVRDEPQPEREPAGSRSSRSKWQWAWSTVLAVLVVAIALPMLARAGAFRPRVYAADAGWNGQFVDGDGGAGVMAMEGVTASSDVSGTVTIANGGWSTVRILGVTVTGDGFTFDHATVGITHHADGDTVRPNGQRLTPQAPVTLGPGDSLDITLFLHIADCRAVAATGERATVRVSSWRGVQTVAIALPTVRHTYGGWSVTNPHDPNGISSLRYLADAVCDIGMDG